MEDDWTFVFGSGHTYAETLKQRTKAQTNTETKRTASKPVKKNTSRKQKADRTPRRRKAFRPRRQSIYNDESDFTSHYDAGNYELAGRDITNTFFDLRSGAKARHRQKDRLEKYWSFRSVNPGQVGQTHYTRQEPGGSRFKVDFDCPLQEADTVKMTKQTLYQEAQIFPRPPTYHHRHSDKTRHIISARRAQRFRDKKHIHTNQQDYYDNEFHSIYQYYTTGDPSLFWRHGDVEYEREHFREGSTFWLRYWADWEGGCGGVGEDEEWRWMWCGRCGELEVKMQGGPVWEETALGAFVDPSASFLVPANADAADSQGVCGVLCSSTDTDVTCEMAELMEMFARAKYDDVEQSDEVSGWELV